MNQPGQLISADGQECYTSTIAAVPALAQDHHQCCWWGFGYPSMNVRSEIDNCSSLFRWLESVRKVLLLHFLQK